MGSLVSGYYGAKCGDCPFQSECVGGTGKESSLAMALKQNAKRMAAKMQTPEAKEKYKKRKETVEWPFEKHKTKYEIHGIPHQRNRKSANRIHPNMHKP
ncbi:MAG: hypothetical protein DDT40_01280 [candidate division WS2 bacterium]|nr:hypothetical protein [Candidatus Psychracetigena formicireducens]